MSWQINLQFFLDKFENAIVNLYSLTLLNLFFANFVPKNYHKFFFPILYCDLLYSKIFFGLNDRVHALILAGIEEISQFYVEIEERLDVEFDFNFLQNQPHSQSLIFKAEFSPQ